jgi:hypothetical protein
MVYCITLSCTNVYQFSCTYKYNTKQQLKLHKPKGTLGNQNNKKNNRTKHKANQNMKERSKQNKQQIKN